MNRKVIDMTKPGNSIEIEPADAGRTGSTD